VYNRLTIDVRSNPHRNENRDAVELVKSVEKESVTIYDRAYLSRKVIEAHRDHGSFFLFRGRSGGTHGAVAKFFRSRSLQKKWVFEGIEIRLIGYRNSKTRERMVFATNLCAKKFSDKEVADLYIKRWEIEIGIKQSNNHGFKQWHSKSENGLLQELYTHYWLLNYARLQAMAGARPQEDWLKEKNYTRANFKLLVELVVDSIPLVLKKLFRSFAERVADFVRRTKASRTRMARHYPRVVKSTKDIYKLESVVPRRS
jgi:hypothetical protein